MPYVDGFVIPMPKKNLRAYTTMSRKCAKVWKEHGALQYIECMGDDLQPAFGLPFPKLAKAKPGETVVFSWILYKNKADRDRINKLVMKDPRMTAICNPQNMPFDVKRMGFGGFKTIVQA